MRAEELTFYLTHDGIEPQAQFFPDGTPAPKDLVTVAKALFGGRCIKPYRGVRLRVGRQGHVRRARPMADVVRFIRSLSQRFPWK